MRRSKYFVLNTLASLANQVIVVICGFILPQLILNYYGSSVNGLIQSITQFIGLVGIFDAGMGVVIEACLYKPLAEGDSRKIGQVMTSGQRFYYRFVAILGVYIVSLIFIMPKLVPEFDATYTITLMLAISLSSFGQYCLGVTNSILLSADQKKYINLVASTIVTILNTVIGALLIKNNFSIQIVKLVASLVYIARPIFLAVYVKKHYIVNWHASYSGEPIKQKWYGFAQHLAFLVVGNTDVTVLTIMSSIENVSIYSTYFLVINGIKTMISAVTSGFDSLLGNMLAKNEKYNISLTFNCFEVFVHVIVTFLFGITGLLIVPFILIYTKNVNDANYNQPFFASMICLAYAVYCLRIPYITVVKVAGHFKQTQLSSIVEAAINILVSVICVSKFGLVGVAFGTMVAMAYRTIYLVFYVRNIIYRSPKYFLKYICIDIILLSLMIVTTHHLTIVSYSYISWLVLALKVSAISFVEVCMLFYRKQFGIILHKFKYKT